MYVCCDKCSFLSDGKMKQIRRSRTPRARRSTRFPARALIAAEPPFPPPTHPPSSQREVYDYHSETEELRPDLTVLELPPPDTPHMETPHVETPHVESSHKEAPLAESPPARRVTYPAEVTYPSGELSPAKTKTPIEDYASEDIDPSYSEFSVEGSASGPPKVDNSSPGQAAGLFEMGERRAPLLLRRYVFEPGTLVTAVDDVTSSRASTPPGTRSSSGSAPSSPAAHAAAAAEEEGRGEAGEEWWAGGRGGNAGVFCSNPCALKVRGPAWAVLSTGCQILVLPESENEDVSEPTSASAEAAETETKKTNSGERQQNIQNDVSVTTLAALLKNRRKEEESKRAEERRKGEEKIEGWKIDERIYEKGSSGEDGHEFEEDLVLQVRDGAEVTFVFLQIPEPHFSLFASHVVLVDVSLLRGAIAREVNGSQNEASEHGPPENSHIAQSKEERGFDRSNSTDPRISNNQSAASIDSIAETVSLADSDFAVSGMLLSKSSVNAAETQLLTRQQISRFFEWDSPNASITPVPSIPRTPPPPSTYLTANSGAKSSKSQGPLGNSNDKKSGQAMQVDTSKQTREGSNLTTWNPPPLKEFLPQQSEEEKDAVAENKKIQNARELSRLQRQTAKIEKQVERFVRREFHRNLSLTEYLQNIDRRLTHLREKSLQALDDHAKAPTESPGAPSPLPRHQHTFPRPSVGFRSDSENSVSYPSETYDGAETDGELGGELGGDGRDGGGEETVGSWVDDGRLTRLPHWNLSLALVDDDEPTQSYSVSRSDSDTLRSDADRRSEEERRVRAERRLNERRGRRGRREANGSGSRPARATPRAPAARESHGHTRHHTHPHTHTTTHPHTRQANSRVRGAKGLREEGGGEGDEGRGAQHLAHALEPRSRQVTLTRGLTPRHQSFAAIDRQSNGSKQSSRSSQQTPHFSLDPSPDEDFSNEGGDGEGVRNGIEKEAPAFQAGSPGSPLREMAAAGLRRLLRLTPLSAT